MIYPIVKIFEKKTTDKSAWKMFKFCQKVSGGKIRLKGKFEHIAVDYLSWLSYYMLGDS